MELAEFQQKGDYLPKQKRKVEKVELLRLKAEQLRHMAFEEDEHSIHEKGLRIVILEGIYTGEEVEENRERLDFFFEELELELREEIESSMGPVERMQFFPENAKQGIVKVKFASSVHADQCVKVMEGRFFAGRVLHAKFWDGKTDYRIVRETQDELNARIDDFGKWLEG